MWLPPTCHPFVTHLPSCPTLQTHESSQPKSSDPAESSCHSSKPAKSSNLAKSSSHSSKPAKSSNLAKSSSHSSKPAKSSDLYCSYVCIMLVFGMTMCFQKTRQYNCTTIFIDQDRIMLQYSGLSTRTKSGSNILSVTFLRFTKV